MSPQDGADAPPLQHIFRWDLDKTYLHTEFDTWRDLVRTAMETPEVKRAVAGATVLLRELRAGAACHLTVLSGSPEQMRSTLESKLRLDGIQWDEFILKPSLRHIMRLRFRALRDQVGYKLPALLRSRRSLPGAVPETLFGDDAEADALVYSLYADILGGRVTPRRLAAVLEAAGVYPDVREEIVALAHEVPREDPVRRIIIHLERKSDPTFFRRYGPRVVPVRNYLQAAVVLVEDGTLRADSGARVAMTLLRGGATTAELGDSVRDLVAAGHLRGAGPAAVGGALAEVAGDALEASLAERLREAIEAGEAPPAPDLDWVTTLAEDRERWEEAKRAHRAAVRARTEG